jgi:hypothetical protein
MFGHESKIECDYSDLFPTLLWGSWYLWIWAPRNYMGWPSVCLWLCSRRWKIIPELVHEHIQMITEMNLFIYAKKYFYPSNHLFTALSLRQKNLVLNIFEFLFFFFQSKSYLHFNLYYILRAENTIISPVSLVILWFLPLGEISGVFMSRAKLSWLTGFENRGYD